MLLSAQPDSLRTQRCRPGRNEEELAATVPGGLDRRIFRHLIDTDVARRLGHFPGYDLEQALSLDHAGLVESASRTACANTKCCPPAVSMTGFSPPEVRAVRDFWLAMDRIQASRASSLNPAWRRERAERVSDPE